MSKKEKIEKNDKNLEEKSDEVDIINEDVVKKQKDTENNEVKKEETKNDNKNLDDENKKTEKEIKAKTTNLHNKKEAEDNKKEIINSDTDDKNKLNKDIEIEEISNDENLEDIKGEYIEKDGKKPLSKGKIILIALLSIYIIGVIAFSKFTYANTFINGKKASFKPLKNTFSEVELAPINIKGRDNTKYSLSPLEVGMEVNEDDIVSIKQNAFIWPIEIFPKKSYDVEIEKSVDKDKLKDWVENSDLNKNIVEPVNAKIEKTDSEYEIVEEVIGNKLDNDKVVELISEAFLDGEKEVVLEEAYINPEITKDSLQERRKALNKLKDCEITIDLDGKEEKLYDLQHFLNEETLEIDRDKLKKYIDEIKRNYDNQGIERDFRTSSGQNIKVRGGIFGNRINRDKTVEKIVDALEKGESATIEPVYTHKSINGGNIGNTYIEISIARQYMWYYKNGNLIVQTPVVTGTANGRHDTPRGVYEAWLMEANRYLKGFNDDGSKYKVPVKYWIQLDYTGVGIHDTYYRGAYGGNIYKYNGSHGCINTPLGNVSKLYNNLEKGTPAIIY